MYIHFQKKKKIYTVIFIIINCSRQKIQRDKTFMDTLQNVYDGRYTDFDFHFEFFKHF